MAKLIFGAKKQHERSITTIALMIALVLVALYFGARGALWVGTHFTGRAEVNALADFERAQALVAQGDFKTAKDLLKNAALHVKDPVQAPRIALLQAEVAQKTGDSAELLALLDRATKDFSASPEYPALAARYARALEDGGRVDDAVAVYTRLRDTAPPELRAPALAGLGRQALKVRDLATARQLFRQGVNDAKWGSEAWDENLDALGKLNVEMIFAPEATPESKVYTVEKGDNLTNIGIKLNTTQGLLLRANNLSEDTQLSLGQRLKYTPKDFRIVIERSTCRLFLFDKDGLFKRYHVGLGMPSHETALGKYTIGNKQKDPTWFKPGGAPVPAGDPANELGTRWMPLGPAEAGLPTDLGIHGTIAPETIGQYKSHGCPRMRKEDVEELYDLVVRSTPVEIVEAMPPPTPA